MQLGSHLSGQLNFFALRGRTVENIERSQLSRDIGGDVTLIARINVRDWSLKSPGIPYEVRRINMLFLLAAASPAYTPSIK